MASPLITSNHETKTLSSNNTQTLVVPVFDKIMSCALLFTDASGDPVTETDIRDEISFIRLAINGQDVINTNAVGLYDLYEAAGVRVGQNTGIGGVIELNIGSLLYKDPVASEIFGWGTADIQNIQVSVTAGTLSTIQDVQVVTGRIVTAQPENLGAYCRYIDYPQSFNSTGDDTVDTLPRDPNTSYLMVLTTVGAAGTITFGELSVDKNRIRERLSSNVNALHLSNAGFFQLNGYYLYNFMDGTLTGRLPMRTSNGRQVGDLRFKTTFSVAPGAAGYNMRALTVENFPSTLGVTNG